MAMSEVMAPLTYIPTSLAIMSPDISIPFLADIPVIFMPMPEVSDVAMILVACMPVVLPFMSPATNIPMPEVDETLPAYIPQCLPLTEPLTRMAVPLDSDVVVTLPAYMPYSPPLMKVLTYIPVPELAVILLAYMASRYPLIELKTCIPTPSVDVASTLPAYTP